MGFFQIRAEFCMAEKDEVLKYANPTNYCYLSIHCQNLSLKIYDLHKLKKMNGYKRPNFCVC